MKNHKFLSRRKFLIRVSLLGFASLVAFGSAPTLLNQWRKFKSLKLSTKHAVSYVGASNISSPVLRSSAYFSAFFAGMQPNETDVSDLETLFRFVAMKDSNYYTQLVYLASHANKVSHRKFNKPIEELNHYESNMLITSIMKHRNNRKQYKNNRKSKLLALVSEKERALRLMHASTIPLTFRVYANSGLDWKSRGYTTWPGVPGNTFGYTNPVSLSAC